MANKYREITTEEPEVIEQEIVVEKTTDSKPQKTSKPRKRGVLGKGLSAVFSGTFLTNDKTLKHLPFILFLAFIAILYIANGYYADDKIREVNKISNQLKELRSEYISTKSDLMFASKQSEVAKAAEKLGLKEPVVPPIKIKVDSLQLYKSGN
ncbi:MAG: FtsL-like putative cell division protein [Bacteroidota bacterium]|nr:FtsL-like putative cell division protein [Bacteroidota bacterium]MDP3144106.1 FtsL-like putative cell division protein [Bacteroidota bacterium]